LTDPLIAVRAIHFAATIQAAGIVFFGYLVAEPTWLATGGQPSGAAAKFRAQMASFLWIALAVSVVTGAAWLLLLAARIADGPMVEALVDGTAWTVLTQTRFGSDWQLRLLSAVVLAMYVRLSRPTGGNLSIWRGLPSAMLAVVFLGALAWAGHGGATPGYEGSVHVIADFAHLIAAGAWLGGLPLLVVLLVCLRRSGEQGWAIVAAAATRRFSHIGIASVGTLLVSGMINASFLAGGTEGVIGTEYGHLLLLKIALFLVMACIATVNRQNLLPQLSSIADDDGSAMNTQTTQRLERNAIAEVLLGLVVIFIVGVLGITPPPAESLSHHH
jgi:putative copper resistance protein D